MRIGIIGLPQSGKTTIYTALTGARADAGSGGRRGEPNLAVVRVPDARLDALVPMFKPKKTVYATVEFTDIGGLKGAAGGEREGFSPALLAAARQVDSLCVVLGAFLPGADPKADLEEVELELGFADLSVIEKRIERLAGDIKKSPTAGRPALEAEQSLLSRLKAALDEGTPIRDLGLSEEEQKPLRGYGFLSQKPLFAILNVSEEQQAEGAGADLGVPCIALAGAIEAEIAELEPEDRAAFLEDLGIAEPGINRVIRLAYTSTHLISFLTVGPDEVRAWPIPDGSTALDAAGTIHTDIARGLIRAEVISYDDLMRAGGMVEAKKLGLLRLESKTYRVHDGDICNFLSNV